jgi:predicted RNA binding protein YcfA (HicA-like mRNA interferase family)
MMKRLQLERHLKELGCRFDHRGGKHDIWVNPGSGNQAPVPRHNEIKLGTVRNICQQLGLSMPTGR